MLKKIVFYLGYFLTTSLLFAQKSTLGIPQIKNYTPSNYQSHPNNFCIVQDNRGIMYFGNAYGVLEFDGNTWKSMNLPSGKSGISLAKDTSGNVFIGSVGEIGMLSYDSIGKTIYNSLLHLVPENKRYFGEVWNTFHSDQQTVFVSHAQIILLNQQNETTILFPTKKEMVFEFSAAVNNEIYVMEPEKGLSKLENKSLQLIPKGEEFLGETIHAILPYEKGKLLFVSTKGLNIYDGQKLTSLQSPLTSFVQENHCATAISINNQHYALATQKQGIIIFDHQGQIVQVLNKNNGLLSNNITNLYLDYEHNLWVVSPRGISHIHTSSPFSAINGNMNIEGMGYAAYIHNNQLYLGTSQGVYVKSWNVFNDPENDQLFKKIENAEEQIWYLGEANGELLCGDTRGFYVIKNNVAIKISKGNYTGGWIFKKMSENRLLLGTYEGLELYDYQKGEWVFKSKVTGFNESSRIIEIDTQNNIWVCHGNKGLYKITLNETQDSVLFVQNIATDLGFSPDHFNDIIKINNEVFFASHDYVYQYNYTTKKLEQAVLNKYINPNKDIAKMGIQTPDNIWYVKGDVINVLHKKEAQYIKTITPFEKLKGQLVGSFEFFWKYDNQIFFIGVQDGFYHYKPNTSRKTPTPEVAIRKIESINNSETSLFEGAFLNNNSTPIIHQADKKAITLLYQENALRFTYSSLFYEDHEKNKYQYCLSSNNNDCENWSKWSTIPHKEYTNLYEGEYQFHVRTKNVYGAISPESVFKFNISPPWYRSLWAYIVYLVVFILLVFLILKLVSFKIAKAKQKIEKEKEQELTLLKNQRLNEEIRHKSAELANLASNLMQKNEFLSQLKNDLSNINNAQEKDLSRLIKSVEHDLKFDDGWDHFQTNFDTVYHNFLFHLRNHHPTLKPTDLLLCAYLKLNKTNKEIASILNISTDAVKKRRVRLKQKLNLSSETKLLDFILEI